MNNILDAAERLLDRRSWLEVTIQDVVTEAGCSVGSFYARFADKATLLRCLSQRLGEGAEEELHALWMRVYSLPLAEAAGLLVKRLIAFYQERAGLIRTLTLLPRLYADVSFRDDGLKTAGVFAGLAEALVSHGVKENRARMALFLVSNAIRERVLFPEISAHLLDVSDETFEHEATRALLASCKA